MEQQYIHTVTLLPPEIRKTVEMLAKREDRSIAGQLRQLILGGLEALGELPPKSNGKEVISDGGES